MLLTIESLGDDADDLSWLLHKRPDRIQDVVTPCGPATVFFPASERGRMRVALHLVADPVWLHEQSRAGGGEAWVSPLSYASGSLLGTALDNAFSTAIAGSCPSRPDAVAACRRLKVTAGPVPVMLGAGSMPDRVLSPLGWSVSTSPAELDPGDPERGPSRLGTFEAEGVMPLRDALRHLSVLLHALDGHRPRYVSDEDGRRLERLGGGWLETHPDRSWIVRRYLGQARNMANSILSGMDRRQPQADPPVPGMQGTRIGTAVDLLRARGSTRIADLGCGEGDLVVALLSEGRVEKVMAVDPATSVLARLRRRLESGFQQNRSERVTIRPGSATYPDPDLHSCDAAVLLEVIEHLEPWGLEALETAIWGSGWNPRTTIVTTPNSDRNALFPDGAAMRHRDHRFEWTRGQFRSWFDGVAQRRGLRAVPFDVGEAHPEAGPITQGVVLERVG